MIPSSQEELAESLYLFRNLSEDDVVRDPFPHVVRENALDPAWAARLAREFPPLDSFQSPGVRYPDNFKHYRFQGSLLRDPHLSPAWRLFLKRHLRPTVPMDLWSILAGDALREYPDLPERFGPFEADRVAIRGSDPTGSGSVLIDTVAVSHEPVRGAACAERMPHVKTSNKLCEAHFFLRDEADSDPGGDFLIYEVSPGVHPRFSETRETTCPDLTLAGTIPYRSNTLILFLNTPRTITQLAPRGPTAHSTRYLAFAFQLPGPLFDLP